MKFCSDRELAPPDTSFKLTRVVLGLGTQNYTCAAPTDVTPHPLPAFYGAVAALYDASCLAKHIPSYLHDLPNVLIQVPNDMFTSAVYFLQKLWSPKKLAVGHHYFRDLTTPTFDFGSTSMDPATGKGKILFGKVEERVPAPKVASKGRNEETGRQANGAVEWLRLSVKEGTIGYKAGYRVMTAGGKPPLDCLPYPHGGQFEVPYVTEYW